MRGLAIAAILICGCGEPDAAGTPRPPEPGPSPPAAVDPDGEEEAPTTAWPDEVRSLREEVDAFTTVEACLAELRARTPTVVSEGLADLRYVEFFDDLCRGLSAVESGSVEGCDAIAPSATRAGCRLRLAMIHRRPRACPEDRVIGGRDAVCLAWAARDPSLCRAASTPDAIRCRAVLARDAERCLRLPPSERGRCEAEVARYGGAVADEQVEREHLVEARMELTLTGDTGEPERISRDVLERGVALRPSGCRHSVALERAGGEPTVALGPSRERGTFRLELRVPPTDDRPIVLPLDGNTAILTASSPSHGGLSSIAGATGEVSLDRFEPELGGAIEGTLTGTLRSGGETIRTEARFATFVRDLDPLDPACGEGDAP